MFLKIEGNINGKINGKSFLASNSGYLNTKGDTINHFELVFVDDVPDDFNPIVAGNCWNSSYHPNGMLSINKDAGITNLFTLTGGNYITSRSVTYPTLNEANGLEFSSEVVVKNRIITTTKSTVTGCYNGPLDIIGIADYNQTWENGKDGQSVIIDVIANLTRSNGAKIPVKIKTMYSGLNKLMKLPRQKSRHIYGNQRWDGRVMSFDWVGVLYSL